jgi:sulfur-carrier protein adenylyltransferase/sulfurtransferase
MNYRTGLDLLEEARTRIREMSAAEINTVRTRGDDIVFVDVREQNEWNLGHIPGAIHVSRGNLESRIESLVDRDRNIVIYCARGNRSAFAADTLQQMGYSSVVSMSDGWGGWIACDGDVEG